MASNLRPGAPAARPCLKLFTAPEGPDSSDGDLSGKTSLSAFFRRWFVPIMLEAENRHAATIASYAESIEWWKVLTGDPPLDGIDEFSIAQFKTALREATYRRGTTGAPRSLKEFTIAKHLKQLRAVLRRAGPTTDPNRPGKRLIDEVPHIRVAKPKRQKPKRAFGIDEARSIVAAAGRMPPSRRATPELPPDAWWSAFVMVLFYTGLRTGTVLRLAHSMIERRADGPWLIVPGKIVDKTEKPLDKFLHPVAADAIARLARYPQPNAEGLIFPWAHWRRHVNNRHDLLQSFAGIEPERRLSPHAWRRSHATELAKLGARYGRTIAQHTLDHADERTTSEFYVDIESMLIAQLPSIAGGTPDQSQLRLF